MRQGIGAIALFAALPVISLKANNPGDPLPLLRLGAYSLLAFALLSGVALVVARASFDGGRRVAAFFALALYILAGLAMEIARALRADNSPSLVILITGGLIIVALLITRWRLASTYVFAFGIALILGSLFNLLVADIEPASAEVNRVQVEPWPLTAVMTPNIYWLVLDGYGSPRILRDYGYTDLDEFEAALTERGFTVSQDTLAAYPISYLSISSTLSGGYLVDQGDAVRDKSPFYRRIQGMNPVVATLRSWGYTYVLASADEWPGSQCSGWENICIDGSDSAEAAERALLKNTPFTQDAHNYAASLAHAQRSDPLTVVEQVLSSSPTTPTFALIHLINPHPPYFRVGTDCQLQVEEFDLRASWGSKDAYVEAVRCLNGRVIEAIDRLIAVEDDAVIIVQGDHGPDPGIAWASDDDDSLSEWKPSDIATRLSAFSSLRLPTDCEPSNVQSLINTFRVVLACLAADDPVLLSVRTWIGNLDPGDLKEVSPP